MSRHLALPALLLTATLFGCASQQAAMPGYGWAYMNDPGEGPKLAYGRPSSDEVLVMMTCADRRRVAVTAAGLSGAALVVGSGGKTARLPASVTPGMDGEGLLQAAVDRNAPVLDNFRRTGDLTLMRGADRHGVAATPVERGQVKAFFKACEAS